MPYENVWGHHQKYRERRGNTYSRNSQKYHRIFWLQLGTSTECMQTFRNITKLSSTLAKFVNIPGMYGYYQNCWVSYGSSGTFLERSRMSQKPPAAMKAWVHLLNVQECLGISRIFLIHGMFGNIL